MAEFRESLDGVRAIAVAAVMMMHAGVPGADAGYLGVDIFFVLSGFLITSLLTNEMRTSGRIRLPAFLARRFLRLMPLYWLYMLLITGLVLAYPPAPGQLEGGKNATDLLVYLWLYLGNLLPLGGIWSGQFLTGHLWSLAVEAQYYLVWPLVLPLLLRSRHAARWGWLICLCAWAFILASGPRPAPLLLHTRGIALMIGSAIALTTRAPGAARDFCARHAVAVAALGLMAICAGVLTLWNPAAGATEGQALRYGILPLFDLVGGVLVAHLWWSRSSRLAQPLKHPFLRYLGQRSYGIYLLHMAAHWLTWDLLLADIDTWNRYPKMGLRLACFFGLTTLLAALSYRFYEMPFLRLKERFRPAATAAPARAT